MVKDGTVVLDYHKIIKNIAKGRLDAFAQTRDYDNIISLCTYATSTNETIKNEAQRGIDLREQTWAKVYQILEEIDNGTRPVPEEFSEIEQELPSLTWESGQTQ